MTPASELPVVLLLGPTASGKTGIAVDLVQEFPLEIVSVDSALVYRGMDIGTAKPDRATLARAPHHLIDLLEPEERYSAARFRADALATIDGIHARGNVPLVTGGTMLYFRALTEGLAALPAADFRLRAELDSEARERGWPALHARLRDLDPVTAARLHPNDGQRIQRALEVIGVSGRPFSDLVGRSAAPRLTGVVQRIVLRPQRRSWLHERIGRRFRSMLAAGFEDEVARLRARPGLSPEHPSMRTVGYRQIWQYLDGEYDRATMIRRAEAATRQFAKRQLTWLRRECDGDCLDPETAGTVSRVRERIAAVLK